GGGDDNNTSNAENNTNDQASEETNNSDREADPNNEVNIVATNFDFNQDEFVVQSGEEVKVTLTNEEGHHGISIQGLNINIDGEGETTFTPEEPGEYTIICNIFCGDGHAEMTATLVVL
ncbi:cupredoxin domain-containing protein, partial [Ornithinibacillus halophilus]